jgi:hypothetical protein
MLLPQVAATLSLLFIVTKLLVQSSYIVHILLQNCWVASAFGLYGVRICLILSLRRGFRHLWHYSSGNFPSLPIEPVWCFRTYIRHGLENMVIWHDASAQLLNLESYVTLNISGIFIVPSSRYATTPHFAVVYFHICFRYFLAAAQPENDQKWVLRCYKNNYRLRLHRRWTGSVDLNNLTEDCFK